MRAASAASRARSSAGAARSHFALRQVEDAGAISALGHLEQSSGAGLFHVVTMGGQGENV